jgi:hypothetical protein
LDSVAFTICTWREALFQHPASSLASHGGNAELDFPVSGVICKISLPLA